MEDYNIRCILYLNIFPFFTILLQILKLNAYKISVQAFEIEGKIFLPTVIYVGNNSTPRWLMRKYHVTKA